MNEFTRALGLMKWLAGIDESIAWHYGVVLDAVRFDRREGGWRLILKGRRKKGREEVEHVVCFHYGASIGECLDMFAREVATSRMCWAKDKYPPDIGG